MNPRWLREAEKLQIWKPLGIPTLLDYMERVLGYGPRAAYERLRVANALGELPVLAEALSQGELSYSAVRELSRVATPATDAAWVSAAQGKNLRQIEVLTAGHRAGDLPDDPANPEVRTHVVRFELAPETFAALRQARSILDADHRVNLTDDEFITVLANMVLEGAADFPSSHDDESADNGDETQALGSSATTDATEDVNHETPSSGRSDVDDSPRSANGAALGKSSSSVTTSSARTALGTRGGARAKYTIAVTVCSRCRQGWQLGAGAMIPIGPEAVARAECDAQHIGSLDASVPSRAYRDVSPAVARLVRQRDEGRCQTPGCRSSRGIEIHHVVPREKGGGHEPSNLKLYCSSCHHAQHDDRLLITDDGDRVDVRTASPRAEPDATIDAAVIRTQAKNALVGLGWRPAIARAATEAAIAALGSTSALEPVIREALRQCAKLHHP